MAELCRYPTRLMGLFDEDYEPIEAAPNRWIFRTREPVVVRLNVDAALFADGEPVFAVNAWCGDSTVEIPAKIQREGNRIRIDAEFHLDAGYYIYRLGVRDTDLRILPFTRFIAISDTIPRNLDDILCREWKCDDRRLLGPVPKKSPSKLPRKKSEIIYSLLLDRFAIGARKLDPVVEESFLSAHSPFGRHGGNLAGLTDRLDYLHRLGVTTILINPIYLNANLLYHGYHPLHLFMLDPLIGEAADLRAFVDGAHALGIRVLIDVVCNHLGDMIDWQTEEGPKFKFYTQSDEDHLVRKDWGPPVIQQREDPFSTATLLPYPEEARQADLFHGDSFQDPIRCRLFGLLEDWKTEQQEVQNLLITHIKYLIAEFDFDGIRYDAVKHVEPDYWKECIREVELFARAIGKADFEQIAEHAVTKEEELRDWRTAGFSGMLQFPLNEYLRSGLESGEGICRFIDYLSGFEGLNKQVGVSSGDYLFLDNQDQTRILHALREQFGTLAPAAMQLCLTALMLGRLTPVIYYGTEQEFKGSLGSYWDPVSNSVVAHDCYVREDMFPNPECIWLFGELNHPSYSPYSEETPSYRLIAWLAQARQKYDVEASSCLEVAAQQVVCITIPAHDLSASLFLLINRTLCTLEDKVSVPGISSSEPDLSADLFRSAGEASIVDEVLTFSLPPLGVEVLHVR
ncbi:alpha-amylase family glycosyl hydrolase [Microbulbifer sp. TYP-18]|uniref:alpha-amylase family glycosyl hydrolase n=1 Tax=Microbulbifer sp. TYP-18 TaxID=3230024 RepID=UPI0034C6096F